MALIADLLLIAAALGAAFYCFVLSRRLSALGSVESGIGQAIKTLSEQVARLEQVLDDSRQRAEDLERRLNAAMERAERMDALLPETSPAPANPIARAPKAAVLRADTQPASFRRRLFSDATGEAGV
jgi:hypothetical protein